MSAAAHLVIGAVRTYQWTVRPVIGANCRFVPSCSEYAIEAVRSHGAWRGGGLATRRMAVSDRGFLFIDSSPLFVWWLMMRLR